MSEINPINYQYFLETIKEKINTSRYEALKKVNRQLIDLYWEIGKLIVSKQQELGWGKAIVERLASDLQKEMPGVKGFSGSNLWRMRNFFLAYSTNEKLAPLVREIAWANNLIIFQKCKDDLQREFYIKMVKKFGWTKRVLIHQIETQSYEKYLLSQTNFDQTVPEKYRGQAHLAVKDEYTFDFLGLSDQHSEYELEESLIKNIRSFLIEMGGDFAFLGNQYKIAVGQRDFFIDLLLFHRRLKCLVALELKVGEFEPEHKGKMDFYLTALNEQMKLPGEHDAIGIIICKTKDKTVVEYALKSTTQPIGVATYTHTTKLPHNYVGLIPSKKQIIERLKNLNTG